MACIQIICNGKAWLQHGFLSPLSLSACFCTTEKLVNIWNYNFSSPLCCRHLVLFLRTKKWKLLIYVCICSCCLWISLSRLYHRVLIHCDHTLKLFLLGLERKGMRKLRVYVLCSDLESLYLVKTWGIQWLLLGLIWLKANIYESKNLVGVRRGDGCSCGYVNFIFGENFAENLWKVKEDLCEIILPRLQICAPTLNMRKLGLFLIP